MTKQTKIAAIAVAVFLIGIIAAWFLPYKNNAGQPEAPPGMPAAASEQPAATAPVNVVNGSTTSKNSLVTTHAVQANLPQTPLQSIPRSPSATLIQDFSSQPVITGWSAGPNSIVAPDSSVFIKGTRSLALTTDGAGNAAIAKVENQGPYNFNNRYLEIWIRVSSATDIKTLWFSASSDNLKNNIFIWKLNTQIYSAIDESEIQPGEWIPIVLTFDSDGASMITSGTPNIAALNSFELQASDKKSGPLTVWLGGIATVPEPPQAALTIILDNGWISEYTLAMPTLAKYGLPAVIAEIPQTADNAKFMNVAQLQYLQNKLGWDITCHTWDHAYQLGNPTTTQQIMDDEFLRCKNWLIDHGLGKAANILVWPNGSNSPAAIAEAKKYFIAGRGIVGKMFNTLPPANPMLLYATEFGGLTPTSTLDADVDRCMANHEWCIFYGHIITTSTPMTQDEYGSASFNDFIAHIAATGIPVRTMTDVLSGFSR